MMPGFSPNAGALIQQALGECELELLVPRQRLLRWVVHLEARHRHPLKY